MSFIGKTVLIAYFLTLSVTAPPNPGDMVTVSGEGSIKIENSNYIAARKSAARKALDHALFEVLRTLISEEEIDGKREYLEKHIFPKGMKFVQSYSFTSEAVGPESGFGENQEEWSADGASLEKTDPMKKNDTPQDEEFYSVTMEYTFFITYLSEELANKGFRITGGGRPKVVLLVNEESIGVVHGDASLVLPSATEESGKSAITEQGYFVITRAEVRKLNNDKWVSMAMNGDRLAVRWLAKEFNADYVILGKARAVSYPGSRDKLPRIEGVVEARVYDGFTAGILWRGRVIEPIYGNIAGGARFRSIRLASEKFNHKIIDFLKSPMELR